MKSKLSNLLVASLLITGLITSISAPTKAIPLNTLLGMSNSDKAKVADKLPNSDKAALVNLLSPSAKAGLVSILPNEIKAKFVDQLSESDKAALVSRLPESQKAALVDKVLTSGHSGPLGGIFSSLLVLSPLTGVLGNSAKAGLFDKLPLTDQLVLLSVVATPVKATLVDLLPSSTKAALVDKLPASEKAALINKLPAAEKAALIDQVLSVQKNASSSSKPRRASTTSTSKPVASTATDPISGIFNSLLQMAPLSSNR